MTASLVERGVIVVVFGTVRSERVTAAEVVELPAPSVAITTTLPLVAVNAEPLPIATGAAPLIE